MRKILAVMTSMLVVLSIGFLVSGQVNPNIPPNQGNLNQPGAPTQAAVNAAMPDGNFRNLLIGGDFGTNPWQRGTSTASISTTPVYVPDRWFAYASTAHDVTVSRGTTTPVAGFGAYARLTRSASVATTGSICLAQVLPSERSKAAAGKRVTFSFWARKGSAFSAANSILRPSIVTGTGTDQSSTLFVAGTWTGQTSQVAANRVITSDWARYSFTSPLLATTVNQLGVSICYTPVGTSAANDYVDVLGAQLEIGESASPFERRSSITELMLAQAFTWVAYEPSPSGVRVAMGQNLSNNGCAIVLPLPVTMRDTPSATVVLGTWRITQATGNAQSLTSLAVSSTSYARNALALYAQSSTNSQTLGFACQLQGAGGGGSITVSAEL